METHKKKPKKEVVGLLSYTRDGPASRPPPKFGGCSSPSPFLVLVYHLFNHSFMHACMDVSKRTISGPEGYS